MNKIIKLKWLILIVVLSLMAGIIYIYDPFSSTHGGPFSLSSPSYTDSGLFRIDSGMILTSLNQGDTDVFLPDTRSMDDRLDGPILYIEPIRWGQSDHLKLVNTLNQYVWKDSLDNWKLFSIIFLTDCQDNLSGLQRGDFRYFKTTLYGGKITDTWREFETAPQYLFVAWGGGAKFAHPLFGRKNIDLRRLMVTAEDALKIAEEHGGRDARLRAQNQCDIYLSLAPEGLKKGWWISYNTSDNFEIQIDPYTGEVIR
jgi:hypothetical protein